MIITSDWLKSKDACKSNIDIFSTEWPEGCEVNRENLERAFALNLDVKWLLRNDLPSDKLADYMKKSNLLYAELRNELAPFDAECKEKSAPIQAEYNIKCASLEADYDSKRAPFDTEFHEKLNQIEAVYAAKLNQIEAGYAAKNAKIYTEYNEKFTVLVINTIVDFFGQDNQDKIA